MRTVLLTPGFGILLCLLSCSDNHGLSHDAGLDGSPGTGGSTIAPGTGGTGGMPGTGGTVATSSTGGSGGSPATGGHAGAIATGGSASQPGTGGGIGGTSAVVPPLSGGNVGGSGPGGTGGTAGIGSSSASGGGTGITGGSLAGGTTVPGTGGSTVTPGTGGSGGSPGTGGSTVTPGTGGSSGIIPDGGVKLPDGGVTPPDGGAPLTAECSAAGGVYCSPARFNGCPKGFELVASGDGHLGCGNTMKGWCCQPGPATSTCTETCVPGACTDCWMAMTGTCGQGRSCCRDICN